MSRIPKNREYYHSNSFVDGYSTSILQPIGNKIVGRNEIKAPKSEKSNLKHFSFLGTPNKTNFKRHDHDDEKKTNYLKLNLPPKPGTSTSANASFRKEKFRLHSRNLSSKKNNKHLNLDMSNFEESSLFEDSTTNILYNDKENIKYSGKQEFDIPDPSPQNKLKDIERENEIQRLKEEIRKLQVSFENSCG